MAQFSFKRLTSANLLAPDPTTLAFGHALNPETGVMHEMPLDEFVAAILAPRLDESVPVAIREVFEAGKGAMCYGYYFYPLFMMGFEQSCRAVETAIDHKASALGVSSRVKLVEKIDVLAERGVISEAHRVRCHTARQLRNQATHPTMRQLLTPGSCVGGLATIAELLNDLFVGG